MPQLQYDDSQDEFSSGPRGQWHRGVSGSGAAIIMAMIAVVVFGAGYAVMHRGTHAPIFRNQIDTASSSAKAKPSPAIPFSAKAQLAPPPTVASLASDGGPSSGPNSVPSSVPAEIADGTRPGGVVAMVKAKDTEGVYQAKHQKIFGRGCDGRLELTSMSLDFVCASGAEPALHLTLDQIRGANGNGIELKTGEKYHFDLRRSKDEEREIFRNWIYTHVPGAFARADSD